MLPDLDINPYTIAVYKSERGGEVDSKAFCTEHVITNQHICPYSVH